MTANAERVLRLGVVDRLLSGFDAEGVRYCHWKSNNNVGEGLQGRTDLDILVERSSDQKVNQLLNTVGFKRFSTPCWRSYPAIDSYLAMDAETGRLVHLHLHHQLTLGEKHLKSYRLPWEHLVLATRVWDAAHSLYVSDPRIELIMVVVRGALKIRFRDRLGRCLGVPYLRGGMLREFVWLVERTQLEEVVELAEGLLGDVAARRLREILRDGPSLARLRAFRRSLKPNLRLHRTFAPRAARLRRWWREVCRICCLIKRRYFQGYGPCLRTRPVGGMMVVFLGADGSGKSTLVKETVAWLSPTVDVIPVYFGSGSGPTSPLRSVLRLAYRLRKAQSDRTEVGLQQDERRSGWLAALFRMLNASLIAREKRVNLRKAWRARNQGLLVVADRYPQNQVMGVSDGPRLSRWLDDRSLLLRSLAQWEATSYEEAQRNPPDLVIRLQVRPEVAFSRTNDMALEDIRLRTDVVEGLRYPEPTEIVDVDANAPLPEVVRSARRVIWNRV